MDVSGGIGSCPSGMAAVPMAPLGTVFAFTTSDGTELQHLARVSREWRECATCISSARTLCMLEIRTSTARDTFTREDLLELRRQVTLRGVHLRELRIVVGDLPGNTSSWCALLMHVPRLEKLSIEWFRGRPSRLYQYIPIITAAARHCHRLHTLTVWSIPTSGDDLFTLPVEDRAAVNLVLAVLVESLPAWKQSGGLRNLEVSTPFADLANPCASATSFVLTIADSCPMIETVSYGGKIYNSHTGRMRTGPEQWHICLDTWERFCASTTELTEFDWAVVPFATSFFEVFGRFRKPKLEILKLNSNSSWDWDVYHRHCPSLAADGYGATARNLRLVLRACPALRRLLIVDFDEGVQERLVGDDFVSTVANQCRRLEELKIIIPGQLMASFTDRAMAALATLPMLTEIDVASANITEHGLFNIVVCAQRAWRRQRNYSFVIGRATDSSRGGAFWEAVTGFLRLLAENPDGDRVERAMSDRVVVRVQASNPTSALDTNTRLSYLSTLLEHIVAVTRKYPQARLRFVVKFTGQIRPTVRFGGDIDQEESRLHLSDVQELLELDVYTTAATVPASWADDGHRAQRAGAISYRNSSSEDNPMSTSDSDDPDGSIDSDDDSDDSDADERTDRGAGDRPSASSEDHVYSCDDSDQDDVEMADSETDDEITALEMDDSESESRASDADDDGDESSSEVGGGTSESSSGHEPSEASSLTEDSSHDGEMSETSGMGDASENEDDDSEGDDSDDDY